MGTRNEFIAQLKKAIENKKEEFDKKILPDTLKNYNIQISAVQAIRSILLKKSLIHNDPYKYDNKMTEIEIPSKESFTDSEKASVLGSRLAHYETMLEFLNNYYQFNTAFLNPKRISKLMELNTTFLWSKFTNTSNHLNTKRLADIFQAVFTGPDKLSGSLLKDSLSHLSKTGTIITAQLRALSIFHREEYKLLVRENVMPEVQVSNEDYLNPSRILKAIKKIFAAKLGGKHPFYTDLIIEVIKEDYSPESAALQQNSLNNLLSEKEDNRNKKNSESKNYRHSLIVGLKFLGNSASHFQSALEKVASNQELLYKVSNKLLSKLIRYIRQAFNLKDPEKEITVMTVDPVTQAKKKLVINYGQFEKNMNSKIKIFHNIATSGSVIQNKLKNMNDEALFNLLTKNISECNELLKQMSGLDDFFKNAKSEFRSKIRGIKIEITTITNMVLKANQCRAQYSALIEEAEQMRKLGIHNTD